MTKRHNQKCPTLKCTFENVKKNAQTTKRPNLKIENVKIPKLVP